MIAATKNLDKCYQLLGICREASLDELKTAYRLLARKWHPDLNPDDTEAHQRFITLSQAYQTLLNTLGSRSSLPSPTGPDRSTASQATVKNVSRPAPQPEQPTTQSGESELKWQLYGEIVTLLRQQQYLKAIVLIEGLARHSPADKQVCQWQGIIYSQYGYQLIDRRDLNKARIYLKKALKADPHNQQLWHQVNHAFDRIDLLIQS
jgi:tetratricopeptide (TPR) repeat protein